MLNGQELNVRDCQMFNWPGKASPPTAKKECSLGHILIQLHIKEGDFRKEVGYNPKFQAGVPDTLLCKEGSPRGINFYRERRILGRASYSFMF